MTPHLNHEQICDFILDPPAENTLSATHLAECPQCSTELATLSTALFSFRESSRSFAEREIARRPVVPAAIPRSRSIMAIPAYVAAAALFCGAVFLPLRLHRTTTVPAPALVAVAPAAVQSTESDEALLDEINQDLSASVPSPMQPLADPTASASPASSSQGNIQ